MRTTLTLEEDVAERAKALAVKIARPVKFVVNEALRLGLDQIATPFSTAIHGEIFSPIISVS